MTNKADNPKSDTAEAPKKDAVESSDAPQPVVTTDNPEGIDLSKGAKDAATAFEPEEK